MEFELKIGNRTKKLKIDRVPYAAHKINAKVESRRMELIQLQEDETILNQRVIELRRERADGWFREVRELRKEVRELGKEAQKVINDLFFEDRFQLVQIILEKNGYGSDEALTSRKLWEEDVDITVLNSFIEMCIKKKEPQGQK